SDAEIPLTLTLLGVDQPIPHGTNYQGVLTLLIQCGDKESTVDLGRMGTLPRMRADVQPPTSVLALDLRPYLPAGHQSKVCSVQVRGVFYFYPPEWSQFGILPEYGRKAKFESNEIRVVVRAATVTTRPALAGP